MGTEMLTEAQKQTLQQAALRVQMEVKEWVNLEGGDRRSLKALEARHLVALDMSGDKRLVRVTMAGWKQLGETPPDFYDLKPMERVVAREGYFDPKKAKVVVESKRRDPHPPAPSPERAHQCAGGGEENGAAEARFAAEKEAITTRIRKLKGEATENQPVQLIEATVADMTVAEAHDCDGCAYREVIEMLARKDPRVAALVAMLERERVLLEEMGIERE